MRTRLEHISLDERQYLRARSLLVALMAGVFVLWLSIDTSTSSRNMFACLLAAIIGGGLVLRVAAPMGSVTVRRTMMWLLVPDGMCIAGFTYLFRDYGDAFFAAAITLPVVYALVVTKREAYWSIAAVVAGYSFGTWFGAPLTPELLIVFTAKALAIALVAEMLIVSVSTSRERAAEVLHAVDLKDQANEELRRRIGDLQAVSQVTEIIHSSLEFDRVGPLVLDVVAKIIGVDACALFVVDKNNSETLFSASVGMPSYAGFSAELYGEGHYACTQLFDHAGTLVLFCAGAAATEQLDEEDRLVLSAIASELVIAVENAQLYRLTKRLSMTDELTGLANYRHLQTRIEEEIGRAERFGKKVSLLMLDADQFKTFNDTYGHMAGDAALAQVAQAIRESVREIDLVARYGGEEFAIILPETDAAGAFIVAEKVRETVAARHLESVCGDDHCFITISIGLATYPTHAQNREGLLRMADDALYAAKSSGRNRVRTPMKPPRTEESA